MAHFQLKRRELKESCKSDTRNIEVQNNSRKHHGIEALSESKPQEHRQLQVKRQRRTFHRGSLKSQHN